MRSTPFYGRVWHMPRMLVRSRCGAHKTRVQPNLTAIPMLGSEPPPLVFIQKRIEGIVKETIARWNLARNREKSFNPRRSRDTPSRCLPRSVSRTVCLLLFLHISFYLIFASCVKEL